MELLPYQQAAADLSRIEPLLMVEHAPRIGMTFSFAEEAVATASGDDAHNVIYLAPQPEMAAEFMGQCFHLAKQGGVGSSEIGTRLVEGGIVLVLDFPTGKTIRASVADMVDLRGAVALVIIDQAAFVPNLDTLIDQALPMCMFGGRIVLLSRHSKEPHNFFHALMDEAIAANIPGCAMRVPIGRAIDDGLFRRICDLKGVEWTQDAQYAWERQLHHMFGADAKAELDLMREANGHA